MFHRKFKQTDQIYFIGCTHLQHKNITKGVSAWPSGGIRDFATEQEMTEAVIKSLQIVPPDAHLFMLGDWLFGKKENAEVLLGLISCQNIYYIYGNHCVWMRNKNFNRFLWTGDYLEIFVGNQMICLMHYPLAVWNESHHGSWMIHSHSHGSYSPGLPTVLDQGKILDVGWDVFKKPVDFFEVKDIMDKKEEVYKDHHNKKTNR